MAELRWSIEASNDLDEIAEYIAQDSVRHARAFVKALDQAANRLASFPRMGRVVPDRNDEDLREVLFRDYRIVYKIRGDVIGIITVAHGARDVRRLLDARDFDIQ